MSSAVVVKKKGNENRSLAEGPEGTSKARYLERMKDLELEKLACTPDLMEILERKILSHKDLSSH